MLWLCDNMPTYNPEYTTELLEWKEYHRVMTPLAFYKLVLKVINIKPIKE